jgi:polysaccharide export outer membrane protein
VPVDEAETIVSLATNLFRDWMKSRAAEEEHLRDVLALIDLEIDVLSQQSTLEAEERTLQRQQVENARQLVERGVIPLPRLQELEREASRLSRDLLQSQSFAARARQNKETMKHELDMAETQSRLRIREDLRGAMAELARLEAEAGALEAALMRAGLALTPDARAEPEPAFAIHRSAGGASDRIEASWDTAILPGDILEVAIPKAPEG